jgi:hypothetical protein
MQYILSGTLGARLLKRRSILLNIPNLGLLSQYGNGKSWKGDASLHRTRGRLFTKVQQRVLGVLFGNPGRTFYANEIIALAGSGVGAVQRELARLAASGLVTVARVGKQKHYQANAGSPVFEELRGLVLKTSGLTQEI